MKTLKDYGPFAIEEAAKGGKLFGTPAGHWGRDMSDASGMKAHLCRPVEAENTRLLEALQVGESCFVRRRGHPRHGWITSEVIRLA